MFTAQSGNNGSGITPNGTLFNSSNPNAPEGSQVAFLQSISTISQAISGFVPGAKYAVTFSAAQRAGQFRAWRTNVESEIGQFGGCQLQPAGDGHELCGLHHEFHRIRRHAHAFLCRHGFGRAATTRCFWTTCESCRRRRWRRCNLVCRSRTFRPAIKSNAPGRRTTPVGDCKCKQTGWAPTGSPC